MKKLRNSIFITAIILRYCSYSTYPQSSSTYRQDSRRNALLFIIILIVSSDVDAYLLASFSTIVVISLTAGIYEGTDRTFIAYTHASVCLLCCKFRTIWAYDVLCMSIDTHARVTFWSYALNFECVLVFFFSLGDHIMHVEKLR